MTDTMNKLFFRIGFVVCVLFSMLSCGVSEMKNRLKDVESYIMERPDSALSVLDSMDRALLTTDRLKAHHALLHAMALDKNYIDVTDDSLASVALDYYSRKGPKKYEARSLYYLGLSYYYAGDYNKAILRFTEAEGVAVGSDSLYLGMIKSLQADAHSMTYNNVAALESLKAANEIYTSLSVPYYVNVSELGLAKIYCNKREYDKADSILTKLSNQTDLDAMLFPHVLASRAFMMASSADPDYEEVALLYEKVLYEYESSCLTCRDYWAYAYALACIGREKDFYDLVAHLQKIDTSATAFYWKYLIERRKGNYHNALNLLERSVTSNNVEVTEALQQSLALSQREYYKYRFRVQVRIKNQTVTIVISISILILLIIYFLIHRYVSTQKIERDKMMEYVEEMRRQLIQSKREDYSSLKKRFISVYKSRFESLGELCEKYLQNRNREDIEKVIYQKVMLMIDDIRNDTVRKKKFEAILDSELEGIMTHFRNEMPKSKEWEVAMFSYLIAGFEATTISRLMDMPINNVYAYKRRLRIKIETKNPPHSSQFLEMIV